MSQLDHFAQLASRYDELRTPDGVTPLHEALIRLGKLDGGRVLDIGCGTGRTMAVLAAGTGSEVAGIDSSREMVAVARRALPDADIQVGRAEQLPYENESFDAALMLLVVHHVHRPAAFAEARRVLARGGRLLIATPDPEAIPRFWMADLFPSYVEIEQRRFPSPATLGHELRTAGFTDVGVERLSVARRFDREAALAKLHGRAYSTFDYIDEDEYRAGVELAERELPDEIAYTLEWAIVVAKR